MVYNEFRLLHSNQIREITSWLFITVKAYFSLVHWQPRNKFLSPECGDISYHSDKDGQNMKLDMWVKGAGYHKQMEIDIISGQQLSSGRADEKIIGVAYGGTVTHDFWKGNSKWVQQNFKETQTWAEHDWVKFLIWRLDIDTFLFNGMTDNLSE